MEYGLIGEKLGHSFSKILHEKLADYKYDLIPLTKEEFSNFMETKDFKAINVTIPYKRDVIPYLYDMDDNARSIGAVNTIVNKNGNLIGHNTDFSGFLYMVKKHNIEMKNKKTVILGNGGAAQAVIAVAKHENAGEIIIVDIIEGNGAITYEDFLSRGIDAEIIINTSPVGMYPNIDKSPVDLNLFKNCTSVLDVVYNPLETKLISQAKSLGMTGVNGLEMLVGQAKYAVEFFLDKDISDSVINPIYEELLQEMGK